MLHCVILFLCYSLGLFTTQLHPGDLINASSFKYLDELEKKFIQDAKQVNQSDFYLMRDVLCELIISDTFQNVFSNMRSCHKDILQFTFMRKAFCNNHIILSQQMKKFLFNRIPFVYFFEQAKDVVDFVIYHKPSYAICALDTMRSIVVYNNTTNNPHKFILLCPFDEQDKHLPIYPGVDHPLLTMQIPMPHNCGDPTIFKLHVCSILKKICTEESCRVSTTQNLMQLLPEYYQKDPNATPINAPYILRKQDAIIAYNQQYMLNLTNQYAVPFLKCFTVYQYPAKPTQ